MKKIVFYIPAIIFILFYGWIKITTGLFVSSFVYAWVVLLIGSGIFLSKGKYWGGFLGMLPGIHLIYMSTKDTGQVINIELPIGIIILIFYVLCSGFVFYKRKKCDSFERKKWD